MNDNTRKFWLVWRDNGGMPCKKHSSKEDAMVEADRLSKKEVGGMFYVLEACSMVMSIAHTQHTTLRVGGQYET